MEVMRPSPGLRRLLPKRRRRLRRSGQAAPRPLSSQPWFGCAFVGMRAHSIWRQLLALVCCSSLPCHWSRGQAVTPACPAALERDQLLRITSLLCPLALLSPIPPSLLFLAGGILQESQVHVAASVQDRSFGGHCYLTRGWRRLKPP